MNLRDSAIDTQATMGRFDINLPPDKRVLGLFAAK